MNNKHTIAYELDDVEETELDDMLMQIETLRATTQTRLAQFIEQALTTDSNTH